MFSGTYGDATNQPDFIKIVARIGQKNPKKHNKKELMQGVNKHLYFMLETNGGLHDKEWWRLLALTLKQYFPTIIKKKNYLGIDGIPMINSRCIEEACHGKCTCKCKNSNEI